MHRTLSHRHLAQRFATGIFCEYLERMPYLLSFFLRPCMKCPQSQIRESLNIELFLLCSTRPYLACLCIQAEPFKSGFLAKLVTKVNGKKAS